MGCTKLQWGWYQTRYYNFHVVDLKVSCSLLLLTKYFKKNTINIKDNTYSIVKGCVN